MKWVSTQQRFRVARSRECRREPSANSLRSLFQITWPTALNPVAPDAALLQGSSPPKLEFLDSTFERFSVDDRSRRGSRKGRHPLILCGGSFARG